MISSYNIKVQFKGDPKIVLLPGGSLQRQRALKCQFYLSISNDPENIKQPVFTLTSGALIRSTL